MNRKYILLGIPALLILLCIVGGIWNAAATNREETDYPPEGQLVDVFDTQIHVFSVGEPMENEPAIVLISGLSTPSPVSDFYPVWSRLSEEHYVVVLERPGYGWSGLTKRERTVENLVEEDRLALQQAGISPPYLLVAHSMGGLEANKYAAAYPDEIQGVVLLDCTAPETMLSYESSVPILDRIIPVMRAIGLLRFLDAVAPDVLANQTAGQRNNFDLLNEHYKDMDRIFLLQKYQNMMMIKEKEMRQDNAKAVKNVSFPSDIPVSMIVAVQPGDENHPQYQAFMDVQEAWVNQSAKGQLYPVVGWHYIYHYAPDEVCDVIIDMLKSNGL